MRPLPPRELPQLIAGSEDGRWKLLLHLIYQLAEADPENLHGGPAVGHLNAVADLGAGASRPWPTPLAEFIVKTWIRPCDALRGAPVCYTGHFLTLH